VICSGYWLEAQRSPPGQRWDSDSLLWDSQPARRRPPSVTTAPVNEGFRGEGAGLDNCSCTAGHAGDSTAAQCGDPQLQVSLKIVMRLTFVGFHQHRGRRILMHPCGEYAIGRASTRNIGPLDQKNNACRDITIRHDIQPPTSSPLGQLHHEGARGAGIGRRREVAVRGHEKRQGSAKR